MLVELSAVIGGEEEQAGELGGTKGIYQDMGGLWKLHRGLFAIKDKNL